MTDPRTARVVQLYETLTLASLDHLAQVYTENVQFKDPFNTTQGLAPLRKIFAHMFDALEAPRFVVSEAITQGDQAFLIWDFEFSRKGLPSPMRIHGSTHLRFAPDGRVMWHRDYWDAAEELYNKIPLLGGLFRWLQSKLAVV
jgi:steroid Delta-isomerase